MITIKLTNNGGYVCGDGKLPMDPDAFLKLFAAKIIDARGRGLTEVGFSEEEVNAYIRDANIQFGHTLEQAEVIKIRQTKGLNAEAAILDKLENA